MVSQRMRFWAIFLWLLSPTGGEAAWVVKISEWVSETIEFCFFRSISLTRHSHSIRIGYTVEFSPSHLLWFLAYNHLHIIFTDFTVLAVTLRKTAEDVNHLTINSGLHAIKKSVFILEIGVIGASWNKATFFFCEERAFYRLNQMPRSKDIIFQFFPWHY